MRSVAANDARTNWSVMLDQARIEPIEITRRGRPVGVLVSPDFFERAVDALEDAEDLAAARAAKDSTEPTISHEELMRELGLA